MCEVTVGARPLKVFETVFKEDSPYRLKMVAKEVRGPEGCTGMSLSVCVWGGLA